VIYENVGKWNRDSDQYPIEGAHRQHESDREAGGRVPYHGAQFLEHDHFRTVEQEVKNDESDGKKNMGEKLAESAFTRIS